MGDFAKERLYKGFHFRLEYNQALVVVKATAEQNQRPKVFGYWLPSTPPIVLQPVRPSDVVSKYAQFQRARGHVEPTTRVFRAPGISWILQGTSEQNRETAKLDAAQQTRAAQRETRLPLVAAPKVRAPR